MEPLSRYDYAVIDFSDSESLLGYAKKLEGHTFREVLDLGISPDGAINDYDYGVVAFKGGVGTLIEERYFGYRANSDQNADFADAGVELKTTCFDRESDGSVRAGERLVLTMIAYDRSIEADLFESHLWDKAGRILLIYYERDKSVNKYDQRISNVVLFTPPDVDMAIIEEDYRTIQRYVMEGRADELSESLTSYLGACTKGATAEKSMRDQKVYAPGKKARGRAWCFKNSYMNAVLHDYILGDAGGESIVKDVGQLSGLTFEDFVISRVDSFVGMKDEKIAASLGIDAGPSNKSFWKMIAYRMLGLGGDKASEFEKANVKVRTVRIERRGAVKESFPLAPFKFVDLAAEDDWEDSELFQYFDETRYFFVVFEESDGGYRLKGSRFWSMPRDDICGRLRDCWLSVRDRVRGGVTFTKKIQKSGKEVIGNDLPGIADSTIAHVRPHTSKSAYKLSDGTLRGDIDKYGDELPDGQWMTKQSFWLNSSYVYEIVRFV
jgi:DNA mismatch repair protein MutH